VDITDWVQASNGKLMHGRLPAPQAGSPLAYVNSDRLAHLLENVFLSVLGTCAYGWVGGESGVRGWVCRGSC
jgi:hypothetical protein